MKKIDKLISSSFIGPSILSFFVATFVLVMQFLWKYIDEILGKGFTILELLELIFYYSVTLIPLSVPITILISSVMVFGDMAEKYELSSMKSAGISLLRIMLPSLVVAIFIGLFSLLASNFLKPAANLQFQKRFLSLRKQKSALAIEEGIFNDAFNETIIRVDKIDKNGRDIHDVLIYDHTPNDKSLIGVMSAKAGEMYTAEEGRYFIMKLDTGIQYRELEKKSTLGNKKSELPFMRTYFDQWNKTFDMSHFDGEEGILNFNRNREDMMNTMQLLKSIDTFKTNFKNNNEKTDSRIQSLFQSNAPKEPIVSAIDTLKADSANVLSNLPNSNQNNKQEIVSQLIKDTINYLQKPNLEPIKNNDSLRLLKDKLVGTYNSKTLKTQFKKVNQSIKIEKSAAVEILVTQVEKKLVKLIPYTTLSSVSHFAQIIDSLDYKDVIFAAQSNLSRDRDELTTLKNVNYDFAKSIEKYQLRLNQQYSWAFICVIFLFIGAPLGSIIRKGGYGYPLLVAILFYMIFIINTILGEKLVRNEILSGIYAAWLPCLVLLPFAILLTFMALRDVKFNPSAILNLFSKKSKAGITP